MWFLLFWLADEERRRNEEEDEGSSWYGSIVYEPTKFDKFMERHKFLDATWPFAAGVAIGLLPIIISTILVNLFCK